ncbi:MAG: YqaE/Pmp3 family membrane protein [Bacteroidetes bacterium QS_9_68_14]|nr:MAG: YqaE/Pmp3 family membrane protein [Bacteroidetes bacterium QS_9_68_14]
MRQLIQILIAIFLPPLSVFLQKGLGRAFLLNVVLSLIALLPGSIHALWLLLDSGSGLGR